MRRGLMRIHRNRAAKGSGPSRRDARRFALTLVAALAAIPAAAIAQDSSKPEQQRDARVRPDEAKLRELLALLAERHWTKRRNGVVACRPYRHPELTKALRRMAQADPNRLPRRFAIDELAKRPEKVDAKIFADRLENDRDVDVRAAAMLGLAACGREHIETIRPYLESGDRLALHAADALGKLRDRDSYDAILALMHKSTHHVPWRWGLAAGALLAIEPERAGPMLVELWQQPEHRTRIWTLARVFAEQKAKSVIPGLLVELKPSVQERPAKEVAARRRAALFALGKCGDARTAKQLMGFFEAEASMRAETANALGEIGHAGSATFLASWLGDRLSAKDRAEVARALGRIKRRDSVPKLCAALREEPEPLARIRMIEALGQIGDRRACRSLMRFVDSDVIERQDARLSTILPFPWNTRTGDVAVWSLERLRSGKAPFRLDKLGGLGVRDAPKGIDKMRERLMDWWRKLDDKKGWRLERD